MAEETGKITMEQDPVNGLALARFTVTPRNVGDLSREQTAKAGTKYQIAPGRVCVAKEATWGLTCKYDAFVNSLDAVTTEDLNNTESPFHWMRVQIAKAEILCDPIDFTWDQVTLDADGAEHLSVPVLQRIGRDFLYATNGAR